MISAKCCPKCSRQSAQRLTVLASVFIPVNKEAGLLASLAHVRTEDPSVKLLGQVVETVAQFYGSHSTTAQHDSQMPGSRGPLQCIFKAKEPQTKRSVMSRSIEVGTDCTSSRALKMQGVEINQGQPGLLKQESGHIPRGKSHRAELQQNVL